MFGNDVFGIDIMFGVYFCCFIFNIVHFHALPHIWGLGINYARFTPLLICIINWLTWATKEIVKGVCDSRKEAILRRGHGYRECKGGQQKKTFHPATEGVLSYWDNWGQLRQLRQLDCGHQSWDAGQLAAGRAWFPLAQAGRRWRHQGQCQPLWTWK